MTNNTLTGGQVGAFTEAMKKKINHNVSARGTMAANQAFTSNVTQTIMAGLTSNKLEAGLTYQFELLLYTTMTTNGGITLDFNTPDTLTLTSIRYNVEAIAAAAIANTTGSTVTMGTSLLSTLAAAYELVRVTGSFVVNAAGTLEFTAAQHTSHTDTTTVLLGSTVRIWCDTVDAV